MKVSNSLGITCRAVGWVLHTHEVVRRTNSHSVPVVFFGVWNLLVKSPEPVVFALLVDSELGNMRTTSESADLTQVEGSIVLLASVVVVRLHLVILHTHEVEHRTDSHSFPVVLLGSWNPLVETPESATFALPVGSALFDVRATSESVDLLPQAAGSVDLLASTVVVRLHQAMPHLLGHFYNSQLFQRSNSLAHYLTANASKSSFEIDWGEQEKDFLPEGLKRLHET